MESRRINHTYLLKALVESTIVKAFDISQVAEIAKTEKRLRELLEKQWSRETKRAIKDSDSFKTPERAKRSAKKLAEGWKRSVQAIFLSELGYIYRLARVAAYKKATGRSKGSLQYDTDQFIEKAKAVPEPSGFGFNLADDAAIKAIQNQQTFWIGEFVDGFSEAIAEVSRQVVLEAGEDPVRAGVILEERLRESFDYIKIPDGFSGTAVRYFEGLTANAVTVARAHGQLTSFMEVESKGFVVVNPVDERTCERCAILDGVFFPLDQGVRQMEAEQAANTIDKVKNAHPWLSQSQIREIKNNSTDRTLSKNLANAGVILPPFHFRCRCTIDVA